MKSVKMTEKLEGQSKTHNLEKGKKKNLKNEEPEEKEEDEEDEDEEEDENDSENEGGKEIGESYEGLKN